jgi:hypothetical protein
MRRALLRRLSFAVSLTVLAYTSAMRLQALRWSLEKADTWYRQQPWLMGSNFIPADAINPLEMWQA